jgi:hypothetical protein
MNPNEINKAIAEYCGWAEIEPEIERIGIEDVPNGQLRGITPKGNSCVLPDYYNDLNACHEMEKKLSSIQCDKYDAELHTLMNKYWHPIENPSIHWTFGVTAQTKCEAFLRTIGKWKE